MEDWGTVAQAAKILKCTKRWVQMLIEDDLIEAEKFGYQFRVNLATVRKYSRTVSKSRNGKRATA